MRTTTETKIQYASLGYNEKTIFPASILAYEYLKSLGSAPSLILDIGCELGNWSKMIRSIYPDPPILMIDGDPRYLDELPEIPTNAKFISAILAGTTGKRTFYQMEDGSAGSSLYPEYSAWAREERTVYTRTLDSFVTTCPETWCKLDVQGAEIEVLNGAPEALKNITLLQIELADIPYNEGAPMGPEVDKYLVERGFTHVANLERHLDQVGRVVQTDRLYGRMG